jgi:hypothetical protein
MTRDEQINQYCDLIGFNFKPSQQQKEWFIQGAHWADTHPAWHNARTERPKDGEHVFVVADCDGIRKIQGCYMVIQNGRLIYGCISLRFLRWL